jgi:hypothetical protein
MVLKPWYNIITPREDLIEGKPLDASEFAVHLDHVRLGTSQNKDYIDPERFFHRTYMTKNLIEFASQSVRRLSGIATETSAVFNLATQFGGGKTHALTMLYHLAKQGNRAKHFHGVDKILDRAGLTEIPTAKIGVFVGTEFSSVSGRGGEDEPLRKTPWGEIAYQVEGKDGFELLKSHDDNYIAPAGDDLAKLFKPDQSYLLLFDELLNYVSKHRNFHNLSTQFYNFLHTLSEFARGRNNIVLAISIPASELEMNSEDQEDFERFKKMLDRLGKAMFMSAEKETNEIIRRRLFDWNGLPNDAKKSIGAYVTWLQEHKSQIPAWFNVDTAREAFEASYPFHPSVLSLFERKWQSINRFQQTRGMLRLLALWVSRAYNEGYKNVTKDPLITLGSAPLEDQNFRAAVFEQLGENRLEVAITTDITGKSDSHALRLDEEATETIKKTKLNKKSATIIFFESNGGQSKEGLATVPEIKFSIGEPDLDIGLLDSVLDNLLENCYYLTSTGSKYKFSTKENLIKRFSDRKAGVQLQEIDELIEQEVKKEFDKKNGFEKIIFPEKSIQITDRAILTLVVLHPEKTLTDLTTKAFIEDLLRNYGSSSRSFKSGIVFCAADSNQGLKNEARKYLGWKAIDDESDDINLDIDLARQVKSNMKSALSSLKENIWRAYKTIILLDKNNDIQYKDLGLLHSSQANSLSQLYSQRLKLDGEITEDVNPNFLVRNWPPAFIEWSTKNVRDAFYATAMFPRLTDPDAVKRSIAKGVSDGILAYVGKHGTKYDPFIFKQALSATNVEISDDIFIIRSEEAKKHIEPRKLKSIKIIPENPEIEIYKSISFSTKGYDQHGEEIEIPSVEWTTTNGAISKTGLLKVDDIEGVYTIKATYKEVSGNSSVTVKRKGTTIPLPPEPPSSPGRKKISWQGNVPPKKWNVFYLQVLSKLATDPNLKITVSFESETDSDSLEGDIRDAMKGMGISD